MHFQRNILAHVGQKAEADFAKQLKQICLQPDKKHAIEMANLLAKEFENKFTKAIECLFNGLEDSLAFYEFPLLDSRKIASNNGWERANAEIRRRSRVVGVFRQWIPI